MIEIMIAPHGRKRRKNKNCAVRLHEFLSNNTKEFGTSELKSADLKKKFCLQLVNLQQNFFFSDIM